MLSTYTETGTMKSQMSFIALGLVISTTALGFATVGPLPEAPRHESSQIRFAKSSGSSAAQKIFCYSGIKGEPGKLYRGWICEPEHSPILNR